MIAIEESFIGSCIIEPDKIGLVDIKPEHFEDKCLGNIWKEILAGETDPVSLKTKLGDEYEDLLMSCISTACTQFIEKHARKIIEGHNKRHFMSSLTLAYEKLENGSSIESVASDIMNAATGNEDSSYTHAAGILCDLYEGLQGKDTSKFIKTGFDDLDFMIGGIERKNLIVIAGRPSMGKTAFSMNVCLNAAKDYYVNFSSVEMDKESVGYRMMSTMSGMDLKLLRTGAVKSAEAWRKAAGAVEALSHLHLYIDDTPQRSALQIAAQCRRHKRKNGLDILMVDYVGLLTPDNARESRVQQIAGMTRTFKALAKELNIGVMLLCQLNREADSQTPTLAHLRESGAIEQDADVMLFPRRFSNDVGEDNAEIIVAKNRNGPTGVIPVEWCGSTASFKNKTKMGF